METIAYLHLAQEYEYPETKEFNLSGFRSKAAVGVLGIACATGALSLADGASAYPCYRPYYPSYNYYRYYPCYHSCYSYYPYYNYYPSYSYYSYYPSYYSYDYYSYYPSYYSYDSYDYYSYYPSYYDYYSSYYSGYYPVSPSGSSSDELTAAYTDYVSKIQTQLAALGYYTGDVDGVYGPATSSAVSAFQTDQGLQVDGIVGPETAKDLGLGWS